MNKKKRKRKKTPKSIRLRSSIPLSTLESRNLLNVDSRLNRNGLTGETRLFHETTNSRFRELESTRDSGDMSDGGAATLPVIGPNSTSSTSPFVA